MSMTWAEEDMCGPVVRLLPLDSFTLAAALKAKSPQGLMPPLPSKTSSLRLTHVN